MPHQTRRLTRTLALVAALLVCASSAASVQTYQVGPRELGADPGYFSASWLHDATSSPSPGRSDPTAFDNRAYRTGALSSPITGSLYGDFDSGLNRLTNIGGTLTGKTQLLLKGLNNRALNYQSFVLKLGQDAGSGKTGALQFEADGVGSSQYTGGFVDYALFVDGSDDEILTGTFFFKPPGESSNSELSPNRGAASSFSLWGNNWMYDSDDGSVDWASFLKSLGYNGEVLRPDIVRNNSDHTLGVSLYVTTGDITSGHLPEPTAFIVWGMLSLVGACYSRRHR